MFRTGVPRTSGYACILLFYLFICGCTADEVVENASELEHLDEHEAEGVEAENDEDEGIREVGEFLTDYYSEIGAGNYDNLREYGDFPHSGDFDDFEEINKRFLDNFVLDETIIISREETEDGQAPMMGDFYEGDHDEAEFVTVSLTGSFVQGSDEAEIYGQSNVIIRNDLLLAEGNLDWEIIGSYVHAPVDKGNEALYIHEDELYTPEVYVREFYQHVEAENFERLPEMFAVDFYEETPGITKDEAVEEFSDREYRIEEPRIVRADRFEEDIQEVLPDLLPYSSGGEDYIVRVEYFVDADLDHQLHTEDVLITTEDGEWKILAVYRYEV